MKKYSEKLGKNESREEFVKRLLKKGEPDNERKAWLDVSRESMANRADKIGKAVKYANPETKIGLMSSDPKAHGLEARDWVAVITGFSQSGEKIDRKHLPCYVLLYGNKR